MIKKRMVVITVRDLQARHTSPELIAAFRALHGPWVILRGVTDVRTKLWAVPIDGAGFFRGDIARAYDAAVDRAEAAYGFSTPYAMRLYQFAVNRAIWRGLLAWTNQ